MSAPDEPDAKPLNPPKPVNISFWLWVASVAVLVASQAYYLVIRDQVVDMYVQVNSDPRITPEQLASSVPGLLVFVLVADVILGALMVLFSYKARQGTRSARLVVTLLAVLTVVFHLAFFVTMLTVLAVLLFMIAVILLYLPSTASYFPKVGRKIP